MSENQHLENNSYFTDVYQVVGMFYACDSNTKKHLTGLNELFAI